MSSIEVILEDEGARKLWRSLGELAERLPGEWVLIGGLMVQLHALEHGIRDVRLTRDIDILGQARPPGTLAAIDRALEAAGFESTGPDPRDGRRPQSRRHSGRLASARPLGGRDGQGPSGTTSFGSWRSSTILA